MFNEAKKWKRRGQTRSKAAHNEDEIFSNGGDAFTACRLPLPFARVLRVASRKKAKEILDGT
jgi:hypothetical protein